MRFISSFKFQEFVQFFDSFFVPIGTGQIVWCKIKLFGTMSLARLKLDENRGLKSMEKFLLKLLAV